MCMKVQSVLSPVFSLGGGGGGLTTPWPCLLSLQATEQTKSKAGTHVDRGIPPTARCMIYLSVHFLLFLRKMARRGSILASFPSARFFRKCEDTGLAMASVGLNSFDFRVSRFMAGREDREEEAAVLVVVPALTYLAAPARGTIVARPWSDFCSPLFRRAARERCASARRGSSRVLFRLFPGRLMAEVIGERTASVGLE